MGTLAIAVRFHLPAALRSAFAFVPGQYLTLRARIDGVDIRRPYSICTTPADEEIGVGIKLVEGGVFSQYALGQFAVGDSIDVMTPQGRFVWSPEETDGDLLLLAAGSGITPVLSIARTALAADATRQVTLVYGNRDTASIMFRSDVEDLKDRYMGRLRLMHVLSREARDIALLNGRIDGGKIAALVDAGLITPDALGGVYICGPDSMIGDASDRLSALNISPDRIHFERFTPSGDARPPAQSLEDPAKPDGPSHQVAVMLDGARQLFEMDPARETVLDAGQRAGLELPFSCAAGMCCTCRCRVVEGRVDMDANFSLEPWELEAGFILSCQARPTTETIELDFDAH